MEKLSLGVPISNGVTNVAIESSCCLYLFDAFSLYSKTSEIATQLKGRTNQPYLTNSPTTHSLTMESEMR